jgi:hypothetical protein
VGQDQTAVAPHALRRAETRRVRLGHQRAPMLRTAGACFRLTRRASFGQADDDDCGDCRPRGSTSQSFALPKPACPMAGRWGGSSFVTTVAAAHAAIQGYGQIDCGQTVINRLVLKLCVAVPITHLAVPRLGWLLPPSAKPPRPQTSLGGFSRSGRRLKLNSCTGLSLFA